MGTRGDRKNRGRGKPPITSDMINESLNREYYSSAKYKLYNLYVFNWESDFLVMTKSGYFHEVEIKVSYSDFKADFKKIDKHQALLNRDNLIPNSFTYICPDGLIPLEEVPEYAGLYYVSDSGYLKCVKIPPELHKNKLSTQDLKLEEKLYYNYSNFRTIVKNHRDTYNKLIYENNLIKKEFKIVSGYEFNEVL